MKMKKISPLGFLMESLNIVSASLARELHVDASLVSKWKSGARKINSSSIYFDQIVDFILEESEKSEHLILNDVLSQIYPLENIKKQNNPEVFIRRILDSKDLSYIDKNALANDDLQHSIKVGSYEQNKGRRKAILNLLKYAESMSSPGNIIFIDSEEYDWLLEDELFAVSFKERFLKLLERGFKARFVIHFSSYRKSFVKFFELFSELLFHKNIDWYYYEYYDEGVFRFSQFIVDKSISLLAISASKRSSTTMVFDDSTSIISHWSMAESVIASCQKIFVNFDAKECEQVVDFVSVIRKRGALYSYLPAPAFISTSEELLEEILLDNKVDDKTILECLNINKKMKSMIKTQLHGLEDVSERIVEIFQIEQMERRLREDEFVSCSLSILTSRKIKVSKDQFARALKHLTDQLKLNDNMRVVLFSEKDNIALPTMPDMNFWCKQNTWIVQMGKKGLRISDEVSTVNAASISFERCIRKVPPKRKEKIFVINYLNELSRNL